MNEIKNYTMNFSYGRSQCDLNLLRKLAFTEIHGSKLVAAIGSCSQFTVTA